MDATLLLVGGPSGSGKSTLVDELVRQYPSEFQRPRSFTTRQPRNPAEVERGEYAFVDTSTFQQLQDDGRFLNVDHVYGNFYAIERQSVDTLLSKGISAIKEVHPRNHEGLRRQVPDAIAIELLAPSPTGTSFKADANRHSDDDEYFAVERISQCEVLMHSKVDPVEAMARNIRRALNIHVSLRGQFPPAGTIDAVNRSGYDAIAAEFDDVRRVTTANFHELTAPHFERAVKALCRGSQQRCLEVGPGNGWLRRSFDWPDLDYWAVDLAPSMAFDAPNEQAFVGTSRAMPLPSASFDLVLGSLADPFLYPASVAEMSRVLKPGGSMLLSYPNSEWAGTLRGEEKANLTTFVLTDGRKHEVYSLALSKMLAERLFLTCDLDVQEYLTIKASDLAPTSYVSPALVSSARALTGGSSALNVVDFVHLVRRG